jgi:hypothetical protein
MRLDLLVGAAVGAVMASPTVRRVVRRGLVHGLAGLLAVYDKAVQATNAVMNEANQQARASNGEAPSSGAPTESTAHEQSRF